MGPDLKYAELLDIAEDYVQKHNLSRNKASPPVRICRFSKGKRRCSAAETDPAFAVGKYVQGEGERGGGSLLKARDFCHPYKDNYCYVVQPKQLHKIII